MKIKTELEIPVLDKKDPVAQVCATCRFSCLVERTFTEGETKINDDKFIECRLNVPTRAIHEDDADGWPRVAGNDWCGHWAHVDGQRRINGERDGW